MIPLRAPTTLGELCAAHGGSVAADGTTRIASVARVVDARDGDLAPVTSSRMVDEGYRALERGAALLVDEGVTAKLRGAVWRHRHASWALAEVLDRCIAAPEPPVWGDGTTFGENVVLAPRVVIGARVRIEAGAVIGRGGFGWATRGEEVRAIPQLGGVVIEDDVVIGPLCTVDAGTLAPTRIRRGAKLDAHVHVGHNCDVGEGCILAAQTGLAGSVVLGRGVLVGGQAGFADHVRVGERARVAAKSGVIGDVPAGAVVAGYPAQPRLRWLRALARSYRT